MLAPPLPELTAPKRSSTALGPRLPPPKDPRLRAFDKRWEEFQAADYAGRIALYLRTLDDPDLMDGEMAFEMLSSLHAEAAERQERGRFEELMEMLYQRLPDVYAEEAGYFIPWRITNALVMGQFEVAAALARELALIADRAIESFFQVVDQLAYHGQLQTLLEIVPIGWQRLRDDSDVLPSSLDELSARMADFLMFDYLERGGSMAAIEPELREQVGIYENLQPEALDEWLGYITGRVERVWSMDDFAFERRSRSRRRAEEGEDPGQRNLISLSGEFLGYLRREESVPYTRGEMAREQIVQYLVERLDGELAPRPTIAETLAGGKKRKPGQSGPPPAHVLCPDRTTLDVYLVRLFHFLSPKYYRATAFFEMIPAWLRFLEARGLIDASRREATLADVSGLCDVLAQLADTGESDPALRQAVERWNEPADEKGV